jgi:hypothetical protein
MPLIDRPPTGLLVDFAMNPEISRNADRVLQESATEMAYRIVRLTLNGLPQEVRETVDDFRFSFSRREEASGCSTNGRLRTSF